MILLSELSRRRIRSIQKLVRVGRNEVVVVLRVDKEKGYIDLSKRRVSAEDITKCEEKYNKSKSVHSILRHVAEKHNIPLEELYKTIGWPLSKKYGHTQDAFKLAITNPEIVFKDIIPPSKEILDDLLAYISRRLTPQPTKVRADVEVTCFGYEGIDAVKKVLKKAESLSTEHVPIKVRLVAAPLYVVTSQCIDKNQGLELLQKAIDVISEEIQAASGTCSVIMAPRAVTESDDAELAAFIEKKEAEVNDSDDEDED